MQHSSIVYVIIVHLMRVTKRGMIVDLLSALKHSQLMLRGPRSKGLLGYTHAWPTVTLR